MGDSPFRAVGISLPPEQIKALDWLADQAGHGNRSRVVQELVDRAMIGKRGLDWKDESEFRSSRDAVIVAASTQAQVKSAS